jgi:hypothetical protein
MLLVIGCPFSLGSSPMLVLFLLAGVICGAWWAFVHRGRRRFHARRSQILQWSDRAWESFLGEVARLESLWVRMGVTVIRDSEARAVIFAKDHVYLCAVEFQRRRILWQGKKDVTRVIPISSFLLGKISGLEVSSMLLGNVREDLLATLGEPAERALREWTP